MKRKSATHALDAQLGRAMRKMIEQMEKSEDRGEKSEDREVEDYQRGGKVRGPGTATSDSILARISNGEYVLPKPAVDMMGVGNLETIRRAALARTPRYALGGTVLDSRLPTATPVSDVTQFSTGYNPNPMPVGGMQPLSTQLFGPTNSYGNDLSLTNRMNAGAEQMRSMREGPTTSLQPPQQPDFMTVLKSLLNPQQQAQDAYKAARERADTLDVASGRFDREYVPGMAQGGLIGQAQWEGLPRFAPGGLSLVPFADEGYRQWQAAQQAAQQAREAAIPMQSRLPLRDGSPTTGIAPPAPTPQPQVSATPKSGWNTTPPLPGVMPSVQPELPNLPGGPASKAPIPFEIKPTIPTKLGLEPKGLPLPKEVPYVSPKPTGLSLAPKNVIDYRPPNVQAPQKPFVNVFAANTPAQLAALKQQAEAMAAKLNITPQEAMQKITSMRLEPIEAKGGNATVPQNTGKTIPPSGFGRGIAGGLGLGLASENLAPATGMLTNIASNYFSTPLGLMDAAKLGYEQAKYDEMTSEGRAQYYPEGRPSYRPVTPATPITSEAETVHSSQLRTAPIQDSRMLAVAPTPNPDANPATRQGPSVPVLVSPAATSLSQSLLPSPEQETLRRMGLKQLTAGLDRAALRAVGATQVPGADVYRQVAPVPGFGPINPNRVPGPGQMAGTTTYTIPGVSALGGGTPGSAKFQGLPKSGGFLGYVGTPETAGMTQDEATAYNVANLNRQYEAMKSRNEAYGLSGSNAPTQGDGMDTAEMMRLSNPFYAPGQGFGDEVMDRDRFMRNLPQGKGRRAIQARNEAMKGLGDIQQGRMQGLWSLAQIQQRGQEAGMEAANKRLAAQQLANQWLMKYQQRQREQDFAQGQALAKQPYELAKLSQEAKSAPMTSDQFKADLQTQIFKAKYALDKAQNTKDRANSEAEYQRLTNLYQLYYPQKTAEPTLEEQLASLKQRIASK